MRDRASILSVNEPYTSRQSFTPFSINEPPARPDFEMPTPVITSIAPTEAAIGTESFRLVVSGENFFAGTVINFATYDEPTTVDGPGAVSTLVDMDYWHGADPGIPVYVHNGDEVSNEVMFAFLPPETARETVREARPDTAVDPDYTDPDEMEEELELAREEGDYAAIGVKKTTVKVKKK
jgi:hypothetical protein